MKNKDKYLSVGATREKAEETAWEDVRKDFEQGFQGLEYKFNTVGSSRGRSYHGDKNARHPIGEITVLYFLYILGT